MDQMISVVNGEPLPEPDRKWRTPRRAWAIYCRCCWWRHLSASGALRAVFGRLMGSLATGGMIGGLAWLLSHLLPIGLGAGIVAFLFAMLAGLLELAWLVGRARAGEGVLAAAWAVAAGSVAEVGSAAEAVAVRGGGASGSW